MYEELGKSKVSDIKFIFKSNKNGYFLEFLSSSWCSSETAQVASGHDGDYTGKCSRVISQKTDCCYLLTSRGSVQKTLQETSGPNGGHLPSFITIPQCYGDTASSSILRVLGQIP